MSTLPNIFETAIDANGRPIPGARLYFFATGTETPLATYADEAHTVPNANPVEADGGGYFGPIYLSSSDAYTVRLTTSGGVTIRTRDNVRGVSLSSAGLALRVGQIASSPLYFGAIGDGVADESEAVQAAIDAASGVVDLLGKVYRCDLPVYLRSGITIARGTLDFSGCVETEYLIARGEQGAPIVITDTTTTTSVMLASAAGLAPGDLLFVTQESVYAGTRYHGEMVRVGAVNDQEITPSWPMHQVYGIANSPRAYKLDPLHDSYLEDVTIVCSEWDSGIGNAVVMDLCERVGARRCRIDGPSGSGVVVRRSHQARLDDVTITASEHAAVGVDVIEGCHTVDVHACRVSGMAHGVRVEDSSKTAYGFSHAVRVASCRLVDNTSDETWYGYGYGSYSIHNGSEQGELAFPIVLRGNVFAAVYGEDYGLRSYAGAGGYDGDGVWGSGYGPYGSGVRGDGVNGAPGVYGGGNETSIDSPGGRFVGSGPDSPGVEGTGTGTGAGGVFVGGPDGGSGIEVEGGGVAPALMVDYGDTNGVVIAPNDQTPAYAPFSVVPTTTAPANPIEGSLWVDANGTIWKTWNGASWQVIGAQS